MNPPQAALLAVLTAACLWLIGYEVVFKLIRGLRYVRRTR